MFEHTLPGLGDRRQLSRMKFEARVLIHALYDARPACWARTEDISRRGMFICAEARYPLGSLLQLTVRTDLGDLVLAGRVVHRLEGIGFGCRFVALTENQRRGLDRLMRRAA